MIKLAAFAEPPRFALSILPIQGARFEHVSLRDQSSESIGFGGGASSAEAQTKALYEWLERWVYRRCRPAGSVTSSGWAAHASSDAARANAAGELLERDALLCSWLLRRAPRNLGPCLFPIFGESFPLLQFGRAEGRYVLGAVLRHFPSGRRMLISTTAPSVAAAREKLLVDAERAFMILEDGNTISDRQIDEHHAAFCALSDDTIRWLESGGAGLEYGSVSFHYEDYLLPLWNGQAAFVSQATSPDLQPLYFGRASLRKVNRRRLRALRGPSEKLNRELHPIL